jgi:peptidoglycan/xylan/chitin deacetylase (PgdA/CDA1 family)
MLNITRMVRDSLKPAVFRALQVDWIANLKARALASSGALTILNLHRVSDAQGEGYVAMTPSLFDELIAWLKQRFTLVAFHDLATFVPNAKPPLILSFDDGYKDFIEVVVPILESHRVVANQNIVAIAVECGRPPMNVELQDFIAAAPAALLREAPLPGLPQGADPNDRLGSGRIASRALKWRPIAEQKVIFAEIEQQFLRFDGFRPTKMMSVEDVREVAQISEIGVHSYEHASMASESDAYLREDVRRCREYFRDRLGFATTIYAFPNGSFRQGQDELLRAAGYQYVLCVGEAFSRREEWCHPRLTMFAASPVEARFRALGGLRAPFPSRARSSNERAGR